MTGSREQVGRSAGGAARRGWRRVVLAAVLVLAALTVPGSAVSSPQAVLVEVRRAQAVDLTPDVVWILAVGSDARPGEDMTRVRGDALQLVGLDTRTGAAASIGVPRDSYVPIPGFGSDRVNAALTYGGPQLLARTVGDLVGIEPDYVVVTRFPFFEDMVDDIGGIEVDNPRAFSDPDLKPSASRRAASASTATARWPSPGSARVSRAATSTAPPTSSGCSAGSTPRSRSAPTARASSSAASPRCCATPPLTPLRSSCSAWHRRWRRSTGAGSRRAWCRAPWGRSERPASCCPTWRSPGGSATPPVRTRRCPAAAEPQRRRAQTSSISARTVVPREVS